MKRLIFMEYNGFSELMIDFLILLGISIVSIWLFIVISFFIQSKKKNPIRAYNDKLKLSIQNSLILYMFLFAIYVGFLVGLNGTHYFDWTAFPINITNTYFLLLPQLLIYLIIILSFIFFTLSYKKKLKIK